MKKIKINEELCIKCGACAGIAPEYIGYDNETGAPKVIVSEVDENITSINDAKDSCPMGAIEINEEEEKVENN